ncbi:alpha/beta fold hydrolase [Streptomyces olivaceus]|uniref:alpha/beta fold hydrolase n=1 Tax=Streptomyces olivaceus TaxID=47716 RepID=UPI003636BE83
MLQAESPHLHVHYDRVGSKTVRSLGTRSGARGDGPLTVLVPGLGAPGYLLRTLRKCAMRGPVRLLDVPGFGGPAGPVCSEALGPLADMVARWLATVPQDPVLLVGHSTGAQAALHATVTAPERVEALVMLAPTFPPPLRSARPLVVAFARTALHESPSVVPTLLPSYLKAGPRRLMNCVRSAQSDTPEDALPAVTCPTTIVAGEHDALCPPEWTRLLAGRAVRGRVVSVPGAHAFPHLRPTATAKLLTEAREA